MSENTARTTVAAYFPTADRTLPRSTRAASSFGAALDRPERAERTRPGLLRTGVDVAADIGGPVGGIARGVQALVGGGSAGGARDGQIDAMWEMQRENQAFNLEYLALQEAIQSENRNFTTVSNLLRARHETAKSAIANIRA